MRAHVRCRSVQGNQSLRGVSRPLLLKTRGKGAFCRSSVQRIKAGGHPACTLQRRIAKKRVVASLYKSRLYNEIGVETGFPDQVSRKSPVGTILCGDLNTKSALGMHLGAQARYVQGS